MQQLREIRHRIASIDEIRQLTKAMYTIALSRTFRLKEQLGAARAYLQEAEGVLQAILEGLTEPHPLTSAGGRYLGLFVVNADRGLCGRFPDELNSHAEACITEDTALILGGERARRHFARRRVKIVKEYIGFYDRPGFSQAQEIARDLLEFFQAGELRGLDAVYMRFINDFRQEAAVEPLLPLRAEVRARGQMEPLRLYEPSAEAALEGFVGQYLAAKVYNILVESKTSEQAIRRQAMKNATDNADELIGDLTLEFNKARQQAITREIADIIGGAEALREER
ncbi:MAG: ATP synthase F1 subunit gamma [Candidatus Bipolaricaulia bacterium]